MVIDIMGSRTTRIAILSAVALLAVFSVVLLAACGAFAAGSGQPVVELQQNGSSDITYPNLFTGTHISGTDSITKQEYKFQRQREGKYFTYAVGNLAPSSTYSVELSFVEHDYSASGKRIFNVYIQGGRVISKLDIFAAAGKNKAYQRTFFASSDSTGVLRVRLRSDESGCKD